MNKARWMLIGAMVIFGTLGLFVRNVPVSSPELALYRAILAACLIGLFLLLTRQTIPFHSIKKVLPLLLLSGGAMGINWILLFEAYKYTTVSTATLSYYFAPVIVTAVSPILFREKLTARQLVCFLCSSAGIVMITATGELAGGSRNLIGILFGLGAAAFYAAVILLNKFMKGVAGLHRTFLQFMAAIAVLLPYVVASGSFSLGILDGTGWCNLLIVGLVHTGIAYCLYFPALKDLSGQRAAILSYLDPLVAVLLSVTVLGEPMTIWQIIGGGLILGFTLLSELSPQKDPTSGKECHI